MEKINPIVITDNDTGKVYTLDFDRASVERAENDGFSLSDVQRYPSKLADLWYFAFYKNHRGEFLRRELTRKKTGRSIGDTLKVTCPCCEGEAKVLSPYTVFNRLRKQTLQILKGSKIRRMYIEVHPTVKTAMENLQKRNGVLFPEVDDAAFFVRANECLHPEKFVVRPLPDKKTAEFKKVCTIMR